MKCPICLNEVFYETVVLKQRLIDEWELSFTEVDYINKQQGLCCTNCHCSLRSMTLANCIMENFSFYGPFNQFYGSKFGSQLKLLEINSAGGLHPIFILFKNYVFAEYPKVDLQNLPYSDNSFDLVVHSDTLEHVDDSLLALKECLRVLKNGGVLFYTIPIIYSRMTRRRDTLPNSYHGRQDEMQGDDYKVFTEYGADFWIEIIKAGFTEISIHTLGEPSTIAIRAKKANNIKYKPKSLNPLLIIKKAFKSRIKLILKNKYEFYR